MQTTRVFDKMYMAARQHPRYISSCGGARSSKTYSALELMYYLADTYDKAGDVNSVVSETFPHLKRGAMRDFRNLFGDAWNEARWSKSGSIYTLPNGSIIEFFSADAIGKVHGPQRKRLFVNEVQNIDRETLRQLAIRTEDLIIVDYNPTHSFYINEEIEQRPDCITIHSTYKDNTFLSAEQVAEIESNKGDKNWWRVYGEGKVGVLEGVVYEMEQIDAMPDAAGKIEVFGIDFGFTNDPTAIVRVLIDTGRRHIYLEELCYDTRMLNSHIIERLDAAGVQRHGRPIYADCAEPKSIAEIRAAGFNLFPCYKATRIAEQVAFLHQFKIYVTKASLNIIKEGRNYIWAKDKDGRQLNEPIDKWNHLMDAWRYAAFTHLSENANRGHYTIR